MIQEFDITVDLIKGIFLLMLFGIFFLEFMSTKKRKDGSFLFFFLLYLGIFCHIFLKFYLYILNLPSFTFSLLEKFLYALSIVFFIFAFASNKKYVRKKYFIFLFISAFLGLVFDFISGYYKNDVMNSISSFLILILIVILYFFSLDFLVNFRNRGIVRKKKKAFFTKKVFLILLILLVIFNISILLYFMFSSQSISRGNELVKSGESLIIYNWDSYFGENAISDFEKEYGIDVILYEHNSEFEALNNLSKNPGGYDLMVLSEQAVFDLINEDGLEEIDKSNIPNLKYMDPEFMNLKFDKKNKYSVPYLWGTTGLIVNKNYVEVENLSWGILFDEKYKGKISLLENPRDVYYSLAIYAGSPLVPQTVFDLKKVEGFFSILKDSEPIYAPMKEIREKLIGEELYISQAFSGSARFYTGTNLPFEYVIPKEGAHRWMDNFLIPKGAQNKKNAELFINFILDPKRNAEISMEMRYPTPNLEARKYVNESFFEGEAYMPYKEKFAFLFSPNQYQPENIKKMENDFLEEVGNEN